MCFDEQEYSQIPPGRTVWGNADHFAHCLWWMTLDPEIEYGDVTLPRYEFSEDTIERIFHIILFYINFQNQMLREGKKIGNIVTPLSNVKCGARRAQCQDMRSLSSALRSFLIHN